jgi:CRISPR-associated protein Cas6/Cse3/CasE subtype I-E
MHLHLSQFRAPLSLDRETIHKILAENDVGPDRILFRVELRSKHQVVLVQNTLVPSWTPAAGLDLVGSKHIELALAEGMRLRYYLVANPIRKSRPVPDGKIIEIPVHGQALEDWWARQAERGGFQPETTQIMVVDPARRYRKKDASRMGIHEVHFTGILRIVDLDRFYRCLAGGIGKNKHLGYGLLSVARIVPRGQP